jgi:thiosulfate/3-mercaptopyruvate sulfurtransferase
MPSQLSSDIAIQTDTLKNLLNEKNVLPVFVGSEQAFLQGHIPGSALITPSQLVCGIPPAAGKLPETDQLNDVFSSIGLNDNTIVIAYDDEGGGWAGRLIWTLDVIGHPLYHFLDGGINAWQAEKLTCESGSTHHSHSEYHANIDTSQLVDYQQIIDQLGKNNFAVWDARSEPEHSGEKVLAKKGGHIPGAANLNWLHLMDKANHLRLKPLTDIRHMLDERGITANKNIVTHCQSHHRSGLTYLVGKILGFNIKAYDGSWSEWGNLPDTPVEINQS